MPAHNITESELKALFSYDPLTGFFTRLVDRGVRAKAGDKAGYRNARGYHKIEIDGVVYSAHNLAWLYMTGEYPIGFQIDHKNLITDDNAWDNLRKATSRQNCYNKPVRPDSGTGIKGVSYHEPTKRYHVQITVEGKQKRFGQYLDLELAEFIAQEVRNKYHGEFARH